MAGLQALGTHSTTSPSSNCSSTLGALDPSSLELQCHHFLVQGLASSTCSAYLCGQKKFYDFCSQLGKFHQSGSPCPTDEWTLCIFVTFLANTVQHSTIKFISLQFTHCLPDHCMFWAACNLAYLGFLRSAQFTVPNLASFLPSVHLGHADVAVDSMSSPSCLRLRIKASKTDPFRKGCFLHIGRGEFPLCTIPHAFGLVWFVASPSFLGTIPEAYLLLMSLKVAVTRSFLLCNQWNV